MRSVVRKLIKALAVILVAAVVIPLAVRGSVALRYRGSVYTVESVPQRRVAIIFGARVYPSGRLSAMLADRVATGADLYHAGKVDILLMTGDNSTEDYNEPEAMRRQVVALGVPDEAIVLDYAGRRTYDSCYRARDIFGVRSAILVTQAFHLDRALMICNGLGVDAVGVAADYQRPWGYSRASLTYSRLREFPATLAAVFDLIFRPTPILGEALPIFPDESRVPEVEGDDA
jgi:SanA protein